MGRKARAAQSEAMRCTALVVGRSGAGKSTLINTFFGLEAGDQGYCKVSAVDTGTTAVHAVSPEGHDITLVDTPGFPGDPEGPEVDSEFSELVKNAVRDLQPQLIILMIKMERAGPGVRNQYEVLKEVFSGVPHHKIVLIVSHCGELTEETSTAYKANVDKCVAFMFHDAPSVKYYGLGDTTDAHQKELLRAFLQNSLRVAKTDSVSPKMVRSYREISNHYRKRASASRAAIFKSANRQATLTKEVACRQAQCEAAEASLADVESWEQRKYMNYAGHLVIALMSLFNPIALAGNVALLYFKPSSEQIQATRQLVNEAREELQQARVALHNAGSNARALEAIAQQCEEASRRIERLLYPPSC